MSLIVRLFSSILLALRLCGPAASEDASEWRVESHLRARLIAGAASPAQRWAAIEIVLDPGFKTYWRDPGESGLPPAFAWAGSRNLASAELLWPAPARLDEAGGTVNGYTGRLVLPMRIVPVVSGDPTRLDVQADIGVCQDICIPVRLALSLYLAPGGTDEQPDAILTALEQVPVKRAASAPGPLSVLSVTPAAAGSDKPTLDATVRAPLASAPRLFVEAPANWFLAVSDPDRPDPQDPERRVFHLVVAERPRAVPDQFVLTLTLVAEGSAIETVVTLDGTAVPR